MEKNKINISKFISLVLRHRPEIIGIEMDKNGWVSVDELITNCGKHGYSFTFNDLEYIVDNNDKKRFSFNEDKTKIRANQGHSVKVDVELERRIPSRPLYHGTGEKNVKKILKEGIKPMNRQHVHLSSDIETAINVGHRHGKPVVFELDIPKMNKDNIIFYISKNDVWLTEFVNKKYIKII